MKGTIGAMAMFWALAASAAAPAPAESVPQDGRTPAQFEPLSVLHGAKRTVEIETFAGRKQLSKNRGLSEQAELGVRVTIARPDATFGFAADLLEARSSIQGDGYGVAATTRELGLGIRGRIDGGRFQAVVGGGAAFLQNELAAAYAVRTWRTTEYGVGGWYSLGLRAPITSRVTAGADVRQTIGVFSVPRQTLSADGFHVGISLGVRFGCVNKGRVGPARTVAMRGTR